MVCGLCKSRTRKVACCCRCSNNCCCCCCFSFGKTVYWSRSSLRERGLVSLGMGTGGMKVYIGSYPLYTPTLIRLCRGCFICLSFVLPFLSRAGLGLRTQPSLASLPTFVPAMACLIDSVDMGLVRLCLNTYLCRVNRQRVGTQAG